MSEGDVEVVGRAAQAWMEGGIEAALEFMDPEIEWQTRSDLPDSDLYKGHDGVRRVDASFDEDLEDRWMELDELTQHGDRVLMVLHWGGRGRGSGAEAEVRGEAWVGKVVDGKIVRIDEFPNKDEAMKAIGS